MGSFTRDIFHFDPNMCHNHVTAIPAANHSQHKYFKLWDVYDTYYDEVVRLSNFIVVFIYIYYIIQGWTRDGCKEVS